MNVGHGTAAWGDYDDDGDLDILVTGICCRDSLTDTSETWYSKIYRNDNGTFTDIDAGLIGVNNADGTIWCDYDNDGDLDLFIGGGTHGLNLDPVSKIYRNDGGTFVDMNVNIPGLVGTAAWGDFDNDGDLDLLITGSPDVGSTFATRLYRNDNGTFREVSVNLPGVWGASLAWGDYDNDGDPDLLLTGYGTNGVTSKIFRNDGPAPDSSSWTFTDIQAPLALVSGSSVAWGDYDNDGNLDILLSGYLIGGSGGFTTIYKGDGHGTFGDIQPGLAGVGNSHVNWVDYDNDGDLDALVSGQMPDGHLITKIYRNDAGVFTDIGANLQGVYYSATAWGDYDHDGNLDLLVTGFSEGVGISPYLPMTKLYHNDMPITNTVPAAPAGLTQTVSGGKLILQWDESTDGQTPRSMLTYNLALGTTPAGEQLVPAMSDRTTGYHKVVRIGNRNHQTNWTLKGLPPGTYYWRVQAVDNVYAGSVFSPVLSFIVTPNGVEEGKERPKEFALYQNYPNPFNPVTTIRYQLPARSRVSLTIFNILGQQIKTLVNQEMQEAGHKSVDWDATGTGGESVGSGVYFYQFDAVNADAQAGAYRQVRKMLVVK